MEFIAKNILRAGGFLVAAQVFLTFGLSAEGFVDKLGSAAKYALMPLPVLAAGGFMTTENSLRSVGYTILLWAGAGTAMFFGAVYGDPETNAFAAEYIPSGYDLQLGFGFANLAVVIALGLVIWFKGLKADMAPSTYYGI